MHFLWDTRYLRWKREQTQGWSKLKILNYREFQTGLMVIPLHISKEMITLQLTLRRCSGEIFCWGTLNVKFLSYLQWRHKRIAEGVIVLLECWPPPPPEISPYVRSIPVILQLIKRTRNGFLYPNRIKTIKILLIRTKLEEIEDWIQEADMLGSSNIEAP